MKYIAKTAAFFLLASLSSSEAALSIKSTNLLGFDSTTSAIVDNTGRALTSGTAPGHATLSNGNVSIGTFGSLTDSQIQAIGSGLAVDAAFNSAGEASISNGLWEQIINNTGDTTAFDSKPIFTVIGNATTIADSTQFLIYRHSAVNTNGNFKQDPDTNEAAIVNAALTSSLVVGKHGDFQFDFGTGTPVDAFNLVPIPEPSSAVLLGLGGVAFFLRRRR